MENLFNYYKFETEICWGCQFCCTYIAQYEILSSTQSFADFALESVGFVAFESFFCFSAFLSCVFLSSFFFVARVFWNKFPFLMGSASNSLSVRRHDLMVCVSLREKTYFNFVLFFGLFRKFECQKRLKGTPSFMFCTQRSDKIKIVWWNSTQMHQTCKSGLIKEDLFDEKFVGEPTSSNNVNYDIFSSFLNFSKLWFISNSSNISSNTQVWWYFMKCLMHLRRPVVLNHLAKLAQFWLKGWMFVVGSNPAAVT